MRQPNKKPTPLDISAALDDYKREQDETKAWNSTTPIVDVPKQAPAKFTGNLAQMIGQLGKKGRVQ